MKLQQDIEIYIESHIDAQDALLHELERETWLTTMNPRMLSGHIQGNILAMMSKMIAPTRILELGAFTGYSAICLAKGLKTNGKLVTIEANDELESLALKYFKKAGLENTIEMITGPALEIIPGLETGFDLVYIDADKREYSRYYAAVFEKVVPCGWIIADNILWDGKIAADAKKVDAQTRGILEFNDLVASDNRVEKVILPIRDGISVIRKKPTDS